MWVFMQDVVIDWLKSCTTKRRLVKKKVDCNVGSTVTAERSPVRSTHLVIASCNGKYGVGGLILLPSLGLALR